MPPSSEPPRKTRLGTDHPVAPTQEEVETYALWLGMDPKEDLSLLWIPRQALMERLPSDWLECARTSDGQTYYFNTATGESTWDHPIDTKYRAMYAKERRLTPAGVASPYGPRAPARTALGNPATPSKGLHAMSSPSASGWAPPPPVGAVGVAPDATVLEEVLDTGYRFTKEEITDYARYLGILTRGSYEPEAMAIAERGLRTPLPTEWKPCQAESGHIYYHNFNTRVSCWEHPIDSWCKRRFRDVVESKRLKEKEKSASPSKKDQKKDQKKDKKDKKDKKKDKKKKGGKSKAKASSSSSSSYTSSSLSFRPLVRIKEGGAGNNNRDSPALAAKSYAPYVATSLPRTPEVQRPAIPWNASNIPVPPTASAVRNSPQMSSSQGGLAPDAASWLAGKKY